MKTPLSLLTLITLASQIGLPANADPWDKDNDPAKFGSNFVYKFSPTPNTVPGALPLKGMLPPDKMPWSSSYWPRNKGSINYTWNTMKPDGFNLDFSFARYKSKDDIAKLSPAQKLDLALGHYDYPLAKSVLKGSKPTAPDVEGVCDGWTIAAIQFEEPKPIEYKNADGLVIPFGSSDIKALVSYDLSLNQEVGAFDDLFAGKYCKGKFSQWLNNSACSDLNPGAFHVILANQIGLMKEPFAVDIDPGPETWNQPVFGFEFEVVGSAFSDKAPKAYKIHAKMIYNEDDPDDVTLKPKVFNWNPTLGTENFTSTTLELDYILELDHYDRIIGGKWDDSAYYTHPDLFWKPTRAAKFSDAFSLLDKLITRRKQQMAAMQ